MPIIFNKTASQGGLHGVASLKAMKAFLMVWKQGSTALEDWREFAASLVVPPHEKHAHHHCQVCLCLVGQRALRLRCHCWTKVFVVETSQLDKVCLGLRLQLWLSISAPVVLLMFAFVPQYVRNYVSVLFGQLGCHGWKGHRRQFHVWPIQPLVALYRLSSRLWRLADSSECIWPTQPVLGHYPVQVPFYPRTGNISQDIDMRGSLPMLVCARQPNTLSQHCWENARISWREGVSACTQNHSNFLLWAMVSMSRKLGVHKVLELSCTDYPWEQGAPQRQCQTEQSKHTCLCLPIRMFLL